MQVKKTTVRTIELMLIKDIKSRKDRGAGAKIALVSSVYNKAYTVELGELGYMATDDGKAFIVRLEKRGYYTSGGVVQPGKAEGLTLADIVYLHPKWKQMIQLMKNPPKPAPMPAAGKTDDTIIEEIPF